MKLQAILFIFSCQLVLSSEIKINTVSGETVFSTEESSISKETAFRAIPGLDQLDENFSTIVLICNDQSKKESSYPATSRRTQLFSTEKVLFLPHLMVKRPNYGT
jgi:hypothetical protein